MIEPKIDGVTMKLGGEDYVIPPLNFRQLKNLYPVIEGMQGETDPLKRFEAVVKITHAALSRNYPEITLETVEDLIDLNNLKSLIDAIMGISGFLRGEAEAGSGLIGTRSMPT